MNENNNVSLEMTAEFMMNGWKMQIKNGLTHMITDMYVKEMSDNDIEIYLNECTLKCMEIGLMESNEALVFINEAHAEAKEHIVIFNTVKFEGMGRETIWLDLTLEHLALLKEEIVLCG